MSTNQSIMIPLVHSTQNLYQSFTTMLTMQSHKVLSRYKFYYASKKSILKLCQVSLKTPLKTDS